MIEVDKRYQVEFKASAQKELKRLPKIIQIKILDAVRLLATNPFSSLLPIRKMEGSATENRFRLRAGQYRVVYEVQKKQVIIYIVRVGHRKDVYR